ncbi:Cilia- and flagella-associated protein 43 [Desmophyllum pertusum]|uniref:Cilia- and flagella-associated protein 43 n=1 Tax=Desmophyllum pertusum TaxID=174260 RepID=A0A9X0CVC6_9CNID|nr:Cilia- and flagella-associated protein 43 [Desmophyllum pertusum]
MICLQAIIMVMEDGHERVLVLMKNLMQSFSNTNIVKPDQIKNGFQRVFDSFADIQLDIPLAQTLLEKFTDMCARDGIIPISYTMKVPSRGRKRFVSEVNPPAQGPQVPQVAQAAQVPQAAQVAQAAQVPQAVQVAQAAQVLPAAQGCTSATGCTSGGSKCCPKCAAGGHNELEVSPKLFVYVYPDFSRPRAILEGGARLSYSCIAFANNSTILATHSGIPDFQLTVWNWFDKVKLCSIDVGRHLCTGLSFNPTNWRQLCTASSDILTLWNIGQLNTKYSLVSSSLRLPPADGSPEDDEFEDLGPSVSRMSHPEGYRITKAAIAGLVGETAKGYEPGEQKERCQPISHCWTPDSKLYCGCKGGQIISIDTETNRVTMVLNPSVQELQRDRTETLSLLRKTATMESIAEIEEEQKTDHDTVDVGPGSADCLALHKKGLYVAGQNGVLRCLDISTPEPKVLEQRDIGCCVTSLNWSPDYHTMALGSSKGSVHLFDSEGSVTELFDVHNADFVGVDCLTAGTQYCVSCKADGLLQVWDIQTSKLVSKINLDCQASCMQCSPSSSTVAVGSLTGHVYFVEMTDVEKPRLIYRSHLHHGPVLQLSYDWSGQIYVTGSNDGHVFVCDARVSNNFKVLGHLDLKGTVCSIATVNSREKDGQGPWKIAVAYRTSDNKPLATKLLEFEITMDILNGAKEAFLNKTLLYRDEVVKKAIHQLAAPCYSVVLTSPQTALTVAHARKRHGQVYTYRRRQGCSTRFQTAAIWFIPGHELHGGQLTLSPHLRWLASCSPDGKLLLRAVGALDRTLRISAHHYKRGGANHLCFTGDSQRVLSTGADGVLACWLWNFTSTGKSKATAAIDAARARASLLTTIRKDEDSLAASASRLRTQTSLAR